MKNIDEIISKVTDMTRECGEIEKIAVAKAILAEVTDYVSIEAQIGVMPTSAYSRIMDESVKVSNGLLMIKKIIEATEQAREMCSGF